MALLASCVRKADNTGDGCNGDARVVHDTVVVTAMPEGEFVYNLPCKTVYLNQQKEGKSILFIWLHGGVGDRDLHDLSQFNHLDCVEADDLILSYLKDEGIKAIALFPVCYKANIDHCIAWRDCYDDVKRIIDGYVDKGQVETSRIYLAGASDGGAGTWDYVEAHEELFAAAMPMSCARPRKCNIPVFFFNTASEPDCTTQVESLNAQGCHIQYKHCSQYNHGGDSAECTPELLERYFSCRK